MCIIIPNFAVISQTVAEI